MSLEGIKNRGKGIFGLLRDFFVVKMPNWIKEHPVGAFMAIFVALVIVFFLIFGIRPGDVPFIKFASGAGRSGVVCSTVPANGCGYSASDGLTSNDFSDPDGDATPDDLDIVTTNTDSDPGYYFCGGATTECGTNDQVGFKTGAALTNTLIGVNVGIDYSTLASGNSLFTNANSKATLPLNTGTGIDGSLVVDGTTAANSTDGIKHDSANPFIIDTIKNYSSVTVQNGGVISSSAALGERLGKLVLRISGTLTIDATSKIDLSGKGYAGGAGGPNATTNGTAGSGTGGGGGGVSFATGQCGGGGGGGGYNGAGTAGTGVGGTAGAAYGTADLKDFRIGSGGGGGGASTAVGCLAGSAPGADGGAGGGAILIEAETVSIASGGVIHAKGSDGNNGVNGSGGGAGAGGTIYLRANSMSGVSGSAVSTAGGTGGSGGGNTGGAGAGGRSRFDCICSPPAGSDLAVQLAYKKGANGNLALIAPSTAGSWAYDKLGKLNMKTPGDAGGTFYRFRTSAIDPQSTWLPNISMPIPFQFDAINSSSTEQRSDLKIGPNGKMYMLWAPYTNATNKHDLWYAECSSNCHQSGSWTKINAQLAPDANDAGNSVSIAITSDNKVRIAYINDDDLMYRRCDSGCTSNANWGAAQTIIATADLDFANPVSIAVDSSGNPSIAYYENRDIISPVGADNDLRFITCTASCTAASPTWSTPVVVDGNGLGGGSPTDGTVGTKLSLGIEGSAPRIAYFDGTNAKLKFAQCASTCTTQANWTIVNVSNSSDYADMDIKGTEMHVVYQDANSGPAYARCLSACGTASNWQSVSIILGAASFLEPSIDLSSEGAVHIAFYNSVAGEDTAIKYAHCKSNCIDAGRWVGGIVDSLNATSTTRGALSLAVDTSGRPFVTYNHRVSSSSAPLDLAQVVAFANTSVGPIGNITFNNDKKMLGGSAYASGGIGGSFDPWMVFDGSNTTGWKTPSTSHSLLDNWLILDLGGVYNPRITTTFNAANGMRDFAFFASNDLINWDQVGDLDAGLDVTTSATAYLANFQYRYLRVHTTSGASPDADEIAEIQIAESENIDLIQAMHRVTRNSLIFNTTADTDQNDYTPSHTGLLTNVKGTGRITYTRGSQPIEYNAGSDFRIDQDIGGHKNVNQDVDVAVNKSTSTGMAVWRRGTMGLFFRRYNINTGAAIDSQEVQITAATPDGSTRPKVAATPDGKFMVTWLEGTTLKGVIYDSSSTTPTTAVFDITTAAMAGTLAAPDIVGRPNNSFVVAYRKSADSDLYMRAYTSAGATTGTDIFAETLVKADGISPTLGAHPTNNTFVIAYKIGTADINFRVSTAGGSLGTEVTNADGAANTVSDPDVAVDSLGDTAIVWNEQNSSSTPITFGKFIDTAYATTPGPAGDITPTSCSFVSPTADCNIFTRVYNSANTVIGDKARLNSDKNGGPPKISVDSDDSLTVIWQTERNNVRGVPWGRRLKPPSTYSGTTIVSRGGDFPLSFNTNALKTHGTMALAGDSADNYIVVWADTRAGWTGTEVFGRTLKFASGNGNVSVDLKTPTGQSKATGTQTLDANGNLVSGVNLPVKAEAGKAWTANLSYSRGGGEAALTSAPTFNVMLETETISVKAFNNSNRSCDPPNAATCGATNKQSGGGGETPSPTNGSAPDTSSPQSINTANRGEYLVTYNKPFNPDDTGSGTNAARFSDFGTSIGGPPWTRWLGMANEPDVTINGVVNALDWFRTGTDCASITATANSTVNNNLTLDTRLASGCGGTSLSSYRNVSGTSGGGFNNSNGTIVDWKFASTPLVENGTTLNSLSIELSDGSRFIRVRISGGSVALCNAAGCNGFNGYSASETQRLVIQGTGAAELYTGSTLLQTRATDITSNNNIAFGDFSNATSGNSTSVWEFFRYYQASSSGEYTTYKTDFSEEFTFDDSNNTDPCSGSCTTGNEYPYADQFRSFFNIPSTMPIGSKRIYSMLNVQGMYQITDSNGLSSDPSGCSLSGTLCHNQSPGLVITDALGFSSTTCTTASNKLDGLCLMNRGENFAYSTTVRNARGEGWANITGITADLFNAGWTNTYNAENSPQTAPTPWSASGAGSESVSNGILTVTNARTYTLDTSLSNSGSTFEFKFKLNASSGSGETAIIRDGSREVRWLFNTGTQGARCKDGASGTDIFATTFAPEDGYHVYRSTISGTTLTCYVDGTSIGSATLSATTTSNQIQFGNISSNITSSGIDYIRYYDGGVLAGSTNPGASCLTPVGSLTTNASGVISSSFTVPNTTACADTNWPNWTSRYEAEVEPNFLTTGNGGYTLNGTDNASLTGPGKLTIATSAAARNSYQRTSGSANTPATVEARIKVNSGGSTTVDSAILRADMGTGGKRGTLRLSNSGTNTVISFEGTNYTITEGTINSHLYRIVVNNNIGRVFVDGVEKIAVAGASLSASGGTRLVMFGDDVTTGDSSTEWDFVNYIDNSSSPGITDYTLKLSFSGNVFHSESFLDVSADYLISTNGTNVDEGAATNLSTDVGVQAQSATEFNLGETVYADTFVYNIRRALLTGSTGFTSNVCTAAPAPATACTQENQKTSLNAAASSSANPGKLCDGACTGTTVTQWQYSTTGDSAAHTVAGNSKWLQVTKDNNFTRPVSDSNGTTNSDHGRGGKSRTGDWGLSNLSFISTVNTDEAAPDNAIVAKVSGASIAPETVNFGEATTIEFYHRGVRSDTTNGSEAHILTNNFVTVLDVRRTSCAGAVERTNLTATNTAGLIAFTYTPSSGTDLSVHDATGDQKCLDGGSSNADSVGNYFDSVANLWGVSDLFKIDRNGSGTPDNRVITKCIDNSTTATCNNEAGNEPTTPDDTNDTYNHGETIQFIAYLTGARDNLRLNESSLTSYMESGTCATPTQVTIQTAGTQDTHSTSGQLLVDNAGDGAALNYTVASGDTNTAKWLEVRDANANYYRECDAISGGSGDSTSEWVVSTTMSISTVSGSIDNQATYNQLVYNLGENNNYDFYSFSARGTRVGRASVTITNLRTATTSADGSCNSTTIQILNTGQATTTDNADVNADAGESKCYIQRTANKTHDVVGDPHKIRYQDTLGNAVVDPTNTFGISDLITYTTTCAAGDKLDNFCIYNRGETTNPTTTVLNVRGAALSTAALPTLPDNNQSINIKVRRRGDATDTYTTGTGVVGTTSAGGVSTNTIPLLGTTGIPETFQPAWTVFQDMEVTPNTTGQSWSVTGTSGAGTTSNGELTINPTTTQQLQYSRTPAFADGTGWVVESRMKVTCTTCTTFNDSLRLIARDGNVSPNDNEVKVQFIYGTSGNTIRLIGSTTQDIAVNTSQYHTYRLRVRSNAYTFYVDNISAATGTPAVSASGDTVNFGDSSTVSGENTSSVWDYVSYYTGGDFESSTATNQSDYYYFLTNAGVVNYTDEPTGAVRDFDVSNVYLISTNGTAVDGGVITKLVSGDATQTGTEFNVGEIVNIDTFVYSIRRALLTGSIGFTSYVCTSIPAQGAACSSPENTKTPLKISTTTTLGKLCNDNTCTTPTQWSYDSTGAVCANAHPDVTGCSRYLQVALNNNFNLPKSDPSGVTNSTQGRAGKGRTGEWGISTQAYVSNGSSGNTGAPDGKLTVQVGGSGVTVVNYGEATTITFFYRGVRSDTSNGSQAHLLTNSIFSLNSFNITRGSPTSCGATPDRTNLTTTSQPNASGLITISSSVYTPTSPTDAAAHDTTGDVKCLQGGSGKTDNKGNYFDNVFGNSTAGCSPTCTWAVSDLLKLDTTGAVTPDNRIRTDMQTNNVAGSNDGSGGSEETLFNRNETVTSSAYIYGVRDNKLTSKTDIFTLDVLNTSSASEENITLEDSDATARIDWSYVVAPTDTAAHDATGSGKRLKVTDSSSNYVDPNDAVSGSITTEWNVTDLIFFDSATTCLANIVTPDKQMTFSQSVYNLGESARVRFCYYSARKTAVIRTSVITLEVRASSDVTNGAPEQTITTTDSTDSTGLVDTTWTLNTTQSQSSHTAGGSAKKVRVFEGGNINSAIFGACGGAYCDNESTNTFGLSSLLKIDRDGTGVPDNRAVTKCINNANQTCNNEAAENDDTNDTYNRGETVEFTTFLYGVRDTLRLTETSLTLYGKIGATCASPTTTVTMGASYDTNTVTGKIVNNGAQTTAANYVFGSSDATGNYWLEVTDALGNYFRQCDDTPLTNEWIVSTTMSISTGSGSIDNLELYSIGALTPRSDNAFVFNRGETPQYDFYVWSARGTKVGRASLDIDITQGTGIDCDVSGGAADGANLETAADSGAVSGTCQIASTVSATFTTSGEAHKYAYTDVLGNAQTSPTNTFGVSDRTFVSTSGTGVPNDAVTVKVGGAAISPEVVNFGEATTIEFYYRGIRSASANSGLGDANHVLNFTFPNKLDIFRGSTASCVKTTRDRRGEIAGDWTTFNNPDASGFASFSYTPTNGVDDKAHTTGGDGKCLTTDASNVAGGNNKDQYTNYFNDNTFGSAAWAVSDLLKIDENSSYGGVGKDQVETNCIANGTAAVCANEGNQLSFDGSDDFANASDAASLDTSSVSVSMWFTLTVDPECDANNNYRSLIRKGSVGSTTTGWDVVLEQSKNLTFDVGLAGVTSRTASTNAGITLDVPIYLTFTYDAATGDQKIYSNGVLKTTKTNTPTSIGANASPVDIARGTTSGVCPNQNGYTPGVYDEVQIYDRALSITEIADLYNGDSLKLSGLASSWVLNEGTGQTSADFSGNNNTATLGATSGAEASDPTWQTAEERTFNRGERIQFTTAYLYGVRDNLQIGKTSLDIFRKQTCDSSQGTQITLTAATERSTDPNPGRLRNSDFSTSVSYVVPETESGAFFARVEDGIGNYVQECDSVSGTLTREWAVTQSMYISSSNNSARVNDLESYSIGSVPARTDNAMVYNRGEIPTYEFHVWSARGTRVGRGNLDIDITQGIGLDCDGGDAEAASSSGFVTGTCQIASTVSAAHTTAGEAHKYAYTDILGNAQVSPTNTFGVSDLGTVSTSATGVPDNAITPKVGGAAVSPEVVNFGESTTIEFYYRGVRSAAANSALGDPNHVLTGTNFALNSFDIMRSSSGSCSSTFDRTLTASGSKPDSSGFVTFNYTPTSGVDLPLHTTAGDGKCLKVSAGSGANTNGLVRHWSLNDGSGTTVLDHSGNGANASFSGTPTWQSETNCKVGKCLNFSGSGQSISSTNATNLPTTAITVSSWVYLTSHANWNDLVHNNWASPNGSWLLYSNSSGTATFGVTDAAGGQHNASGCAAAFTLNSWHQLTGTYDGSTVRVYLDGTQCSTTNALAGQALQTGNAIRIGDPASPSTSHRMDDVRIYNRALSATEISDLNAGVNNATDNYGNYFDPIFGAATWSVSDLLKVDENSTYGTTGKDSIDTNCVANGTDTTCANEGNQLSFDGSSDFVNVPDSSSINFGTGSFSISSWVYVDNPGSGFRRIISKEQTTTRQGYAIYNDGSDPGKMRVFISDGTNVVANTINKNLDKNGWHHIVVVYDRSAQVMKGYIDGTAVNWKETGTANSNSISGVGTTTSTSSLSIGRQANAGDYWNGQIDEVQLYGKALTGTEASDLANGTALKQTNLNAYWNLNEGTGQTIADVSGSNNNGTLGANSSVAADDPTWQTSEERTFNRGERIEFTNAYVFGVRDGLWVSKTNLSVIRQSACGTTEATISSTSATDSGGKLAISDQITPLRYTVADTDTTGAKSIKIQDAFVNYIQQCDSVSGSITREYAVSTAMYISTLTSRIDDQATYEQLVFNLGENIVINSSFPAYTYSIRGTKVGRGSLDVFVVRASTTANEQTCAGSSASTGLISVTCQIPSSANKLHNTIGEAHKTGFRDKISGTYQNSQVNATNTYGVSDLLFMSTESGSIDDNIRTDCSGAICPNELNALSFDGTDDWVSGSSDNNLNVTNGNSKTYEAWFKSTSPTANQYILWKEGNCLGYYVRVNDTSGNIRANFSTGNNGCTGVANYSITSSGTNYTDGVWHHLAFVIDRSTTPGSATLYIDGVNKGSRADIDANGNGGGSFRVGTLWNNTQFFKGEIRDVKISTLARYTSAFVPPMRAYSDNSTNTQLLWKFDEGTGQTAADSSGNSFNGTLGVSSSVAADDPTWTTAEENIYNRGETVTSTLYTFGVRGTTQVLSSKTDYFTVDVLTNTNSNNEENITAEDTDGSGQLAWSYQIAAGDTCDSDTKIDTANAAKRLKISDTFTNYSDQADSVSGSITNEWGVSCKVLIGTSNTIPANGQATFGQSVYNLGETANFQYYYFSARDTLVDRDMTLQVRNSADSALDASYSASSDATGLVNTNQVLPTTQSIADHTLTGRAKFLRTVENSNTDQNSTNTVGLSNLLRISTSASSVDDHITTNAEIYNRGETVTYSFYIYNVRSTVIASQSSNITFEALNNANAVECGGLQTKSSDAAALVSGTCAIGVSDVATNDTTGSSKRARVKWPNTTSNYVDQADTVTGVTTVNPEWTVSSKYLIDVWTQKPSPENSTNVANCSRAANKDTAFNISTPTPAENICTWVRVANIRSVGRNAITVNPTMTYLFTGAGEDTGAWNLTTGADGWTQAHIYNIPDAADNGTRDINSLVISELGNTGEFIQKVEFILLSKLREAQPSQRQFIPGQDANGPTGTDDTAVATGSANSNTSAQSTPANTSGADNSNINNRPDQNTGVGQSTETFYVRAANTSADPNSTINWNFNFYTTALVAPTALKTVYANVYAKNDPDNATPANRWTRLNISEGSIQATMDPTTAWTVCTAVNPCSQGQTTGFEQQEAMSLVLNQAAALSGDVRFYSILIWASDLDSSSCTTTPTNTNCVRSNSSVTKSGLKWKTSPTYGVNSPAGTCTNPGNGTSSGVYCPSLSGSNSKIIVSGEAGYDLNNGSNGGNSADQNDYDPSLTESVTVTVFKPTSGGGFTSTGTGATVDATSLKPNANGAFSAAITLPTNAQAGRWKIEIKYRRGTSTQSDCAGTSNSQTGDCTPLSLLFDVPLIIGDITTQAKPSDEGSFTVLADADKFNSTTCPISGSPSVPRLPQSPTGTGTVCNGGFNLGVPIKITMKFLNNDDNFDPLTGVNDSFMIFSHTGDKFTFNSTPTTCGVLNKICWVAGSTHSLILETNTYTGADKSCVSCNTFIRIKSAIASTLCNSSANCATTTNDGRSGRDAAIDVVSTWNPDTTQVSTTPTYIWTQKYSAGCSRGASPDTNNYATSDSVCVWLKVRNIRSEDLNLRNGTATMILPGGTTNATSWTGKTTAVDGWTTNPATSCTTTTSSDWCYGTLNITGTYIVSASSSDSNGNSFTGTKPISTGGCFPLCEGWLTSTSFSFGSAVNINNVYLKADISPPGGQTQYVEMQLATCSDATETNCTWGSGSNDYVGPGGTNATKYRWNATQAASDGFKTNSVTDLCYQSGNYIASCVNLLKNVRYLRYKIYLVSDTPGQTPKVYDVSVNYSS